MKNCKIYIILIFSFLLLSCENNKKSITSESSKINEYFESYFNDKVDRSPMYQTRLGIKKDYDKWDNISPEEDTLEIKIAKDALQWIKDSIDIEFLNDHSKLSYRLFKQNLENQIKDFKYRLYNYPVNQMHGYQSRIPAFLINMHKVDSKKDAEDYITRLTGIKDLFNQLEKNLIERELEGIIPPQFVYYHVIDDSKNIISGVPFNGTDSSALFIDIINKVNKLNITESEKREIINQSEIALREYVAPAYRSLIKLLKNQLSKADETDGVWKWSNGLEFYANALKRTTTTEMTFEEIHLLGLSEVKRIHKEMNKIKKEVGFEGSLKAFFNELKENDIYYYPQSELGKKEYMQRASQIIEEMKLRLDELFLRKPKADMIVKAVEKFREKSAGKAFYQRPAPDGSRPGTYYANMYKMKMMPKYQMEALAYHEGIPGHHMQLAIAQELEDIPKFRKYGGYTSYIEGWGLYSEYLPKELGFYSDPYSDFGRLAMELWRSCRLVVDTGIHWKKWTRKEGIDYYTSNTPNDILDCIKMVERHIVMPSQATAYKIGMNKILDLREKAMKDLGAKFDIREFHEVILADGALPLNILEEKVYKMIFEAE
jgi:uncharacterized protein (DUF885 family)